MWRRLARLCGKVLVPGMSFPHELPHISIDYMDANFEGAVKIQFRGSLPKSPSIFSDSNMVRRPELGGF